MKYTVLRYEYDADGETKRKTAILPGFFGPGSPLLAAYLKRVHPEYIPRRPSVRLMQFDDTVPSFYDLFGYWSACSDCSLGETANKRAFYRGPLTAEIMCIGEAPGAEEDRVGLPFIGRAGDFLNWLLEQAGIDPDAVLIANTTLCRPTGPSGKDRPPTPTEVGACIKHLRDLLHVVKPRVVVLMGATARDAFTRSKIDWETRFSLDIPTTFGLIHHPAWFLRSGGKEAKEVSKATALLYSLKVAAERGRKRLRPEVEWENLLWPSVERAIKHCKGDQ